MLIKIFSAESDRERHGRLFLHRSSSLLAHCFFLCQKRSLKFCIVFSNLLFQFQVLLGRLSMVEIPMPIKVVYEPELEGGCREKEHVGEMEKKLCPSVPLIMTVWLSEVHLVRFPPPVIMCILKKCMEKWSRNARNLKKIRNFQKKNCGEEIFKNRTCDKAWKKKLLLIHLDWLVDISSSASSTVRIFYSLIMLASTSANHI